MHAGSADPTERTQPNLQNKRCKAKAFPVESQCLQLPSHTHTQFMQRATQTKPNTQENKNAPLAAWGSQACHKKARRAAADNHRHACGLSGSSTARPASSPPTHLSTDARGELQSRSTCMRQFSNCLLGAEFQFQFILLSTNKIISPGRQQ